MISVTLSETMLTLQDRYITLFIAQLSLLVTANPCRDGQVEFT